MILFINSIAHLLVDGACAAALFGKLGDNPSFTAMVLLYTTLAFSTQGLVGLAADQVKRHAIYGSAAMLFVAAGFFLSVPPWVCVCILGIGNSFFHVAAGIMTLEESNGRAGKLGVFVAPGAIGLTAGTLWPAAGAFFAIALCACAAVLLFVTRRSYASCSGSAMANTVRPDLAVIALLTLSVAVRAIGGTAVCFPWKITSALTMLLTCFVFAGKCAGGYLCDKIGVKKTAWLSIIPAAILIAFCSEWMVSSLAGQLLLNLTMPVTLWLLYRAMPDSPGFAFGLAASALWPGTLIGKMMSGQYLWLCVLVSFAFALMSILFAEKRILRGKH